MTGGIGSRGLIIQSQGFNHSITWFQSFNHVVPIIQSRGSNHSITWFQSFNHVVPIIQLLDLSISIDLYTIHIHGIYEKLCRV